ncbi:uncharacterized protein LOC116346170 [Contarinia nasturtii]|uniref:uncharacterized protein LOC116346170 n=1 Tax=Contarinia nasturtii TaxID=265458 RepID=UPI0012D4907D|nr:uncharacterized protein LOC116346170 [Contarinia nasturtii]
MANHQFFLLLFIGIVIFELTNSLPDKKPGTTTSTLRNRKTTAGSSTSRTTTSTGNRKPFTTTGNAATRKSTTTAASSTVNRKLKIDAPTPDKKVTSTVKKTGGVRTTTRDAISQYPAPDWYNDNDDSGSSFCGCCRKKNKNSNVYPYAYPSPFGQTGSFPPPYAPISRNAPPTVTQSGTDKLAGMVGFAKAANVTGGWGGEVVQVNTIQDLINYVGESVPRVLMIQRDIRASSLTKVQMGSAKSIVSNNGATLYNIYLRATTASSNIVFQNLAFEHSPNNKGNDDIQLYLNYGTGYWIDHCSFVGHKWSPDDGSLDKLLYIGEQASLATISNCFFANHRFGLIFGHPGDDTNVVADGDVRLTMCNNHFESLGNRAPGLFRYGHYHVYNNYIENYGLGFTVATNGDVVSEYNYFGSSTTKNGMLDDKGSGTFYDIGSVPAITNQLSPSVNWNPASIYSYQPVTDANPEMIKYQKKTTISAGIPSPMKMTLMAPPIQHMISPPSFPSLH